MLVSRLNIAFVGAPMWMGMLCARLVCAQAPPLQKFTIERPALHQFEDGPVLAPTYEFVPGEAVFFSCRLIGYALEKKDQEQHARLAWQMRVLDPSGALVEKEHSGRIDEVVLPQDKNWMPKFLVSFVVPPFAPAGAYRIPVKVTDEVGRSEAAAELTFQVRGHTVELSETLVVRNFQFLRSENDQVPMRVAAYHPGDMLWARFDIVGYKFGANNGFSIEYGLAILNAAGEQLFSQPVAASDTHESFYAQRYAPGSLSLSLNQSVAKTSYTLVVTVRDKIGNQTSEARQPFQVE